MLFDVVVTCAGLLFAAMLALEYVQYRQSMPQTDQERIDELIDLTNLSDWQCQNRGIDHNELVRELNELRVGQMMKGVRS